MTTHTWQLDHPIDAVVFDCDATLSQIEGIDALAKMGGVEKEVQLLTEEAMAKTGVSTSIYRKRLDLVQPTQEQLAQLGDIYYTNLTPDVDHVIASFQALSKPVYVISAGIQQPVEDFAVRLNIPKENIFAVTVYFNAEGHYTDYDHHSPMTRQHGKCEIIEKIKQQHPRVVHIGDGMNDVEAAPVVDRFIGYGGAYFRKNIAKLCDFYVTSQSLTPVLPLILTPEESQSLPQSAHSFYEKGLNYIKDGNVLMKAT